MRLGLFMQVCCVGKKHMNEQISRRLCDLGSIQQCTAMHCAHPLLFFPARTILPGLPLDPRNLVALCPHATLHIVVPAPAPVV